jgi:hypothetical protein
MKLIIKQYLAALRERDELDAILPDLLSELGLNVFSRPGRGTRQDGVDVAAVGSIDGKAERVYLFSIKSGDLTRNDWDGNAVQSLRPSLNEILDAYIPNRLPNEHQNKEISICLCFGGDIQEQVRPLVEGYIRQVNREKISFEEWNGDKLASLILSNFLREDLLPTTVKSHLRKSLALIDEPQSSYDHFCSLVKDLSSNTNYRDSDLLRVLRQINICLWIIFSWAREEGNLEASYLASELSLLYAWNTAKSLFSKKGKTAKAAQSVFQNILTLNFQIGAELIEEKILPHVSKRHALSTATHPSCSLDVNLKLFDVLGRLALGGIWSYWMLRRLQVGKVENAEFVRHLNSKIIDTSVAIKQLISNNPILLLPIKDDQVIDITLAVLFLMTDANNYRDIETWLYEIVDRSSLAHRIHGKYPCNLRLYSDLLDHPQRREEEYRRETTGGSVLFPMIALFAALMGKEDLFSKVQELKGEQLPHCNFQFWYPDEVSEEHFYINSDLHGGVLSHVCIDRSMQEFLDQALRECKHSPHFHSLSAVSYGYWPLILVACRHYRLPIPLHIWEGFLMQDAVAETAS